MDNKNKSVPVLTEQGFRSIAIDFNTGTLEIDGKPVSKSTIVTLPGPDGWSRQKIFGKLLPPGSEAYDRLVVTLTRGTGNR